ncbi:MAG: substrate-binding domain-containing protein [Casimicrobiaceae bacterium]
MKLQPRLAWTLGTSPPAPLPERLVPLLEAIARTGSLAHAVTHCGMSYRAGWGLLRVCRLLLGVELVHLARGKGATLAPAGIHLVDATAAASRRLARIAPSLAIELAGEPERRKRSASTQLRMAASHDLALAALRDVIEGGSLALEIRFVGSLVALEEFAQGRADAAGFHVPLGARARDDSAPYLRFLSPRRDRLIRFVEREQGLILPRGNPVRVRNFSDVASRGLRFVNRQRGSGTRLLIERHLEDEGIAGPALAGYATEEYTHAAVAATVASGGADAGFGLRAAAAEYGLAFVPLARERYFIAIRVADVAKPATVALIGALRGPVLARLVARLPGYRAASAGSVIGVGGISRPARTPAS